MSTFNYNLLDIQGQKLLDLSDQCQTTPNFFWLNREDAAARLESPGSG